MSILDVAITTLFRFSLAGFSSSLLDVVIKLLFRSHTTPRYPQPGNINAPNRVSDQIAACCDQTKDAARCLTDTKRRWTERGDQLVKWQ